MGLRRIFSRKPNTNPIICPTFPPTIPNCRTYPNSPYLPSRIGLKQPLRNYIKLRSRKLYTSKPTSNTPPHQTQMVLPICLHHPMLNPQQTRQSTSTSCLCTNPIPKPLPPQI
uniref:Uncharacterized protein n=1 Tax=Falco tinnunculus TaxID=100819 RepID=A0A8C4UYR7_FALTI